MLSNCRMETLITVLEQIVLIPKITFAVASVVSGSVKPQVLLENLFFP